ncbi:glycosyltransferase family 2 protein [Microbacterium sp. A1-JK]|uniref:glycosyltransferase family 2 protein n=1 Tax=Microbacterium sp. A1-JK TaxID=3177516 RepID=UPI0038855559
MSDPAITIVVPGYDVAEYAADALDSLRGQTRGDWTAVLVDDGSTDGTAAIFRAAADADPRFRVVTHTHQRGLGAARNAGLDLVDTPFLGFLDADDVLTPAALETLLDTLDASGSDFAAGAYVRLRPDDEGHYRPGAVQSWVAAATDPARAGTTLEAHPAASGNIVAWSKVSRSDFWHRTGLRFPEGRLYEDQVVAQLMYTRARAFDVVPEVVVHWRQRADGSSITQRTARLDVLTDYLEALRAGIGILDAAGHTAAVAERVRLVRAMDLPPLREIARSHPDDAYRQAVEDFERGLAALSR